jgi:hypothetical protein
VFHHLTITNGLHGDPVLRQTTLKQLPRFIHQPAPEHFVHARVNASAELDCGTGDAEATIRVMRDA